MKVIKTAIPDVLIFEPDIFGDERGYFYESYREEFIEKHIGKVKFVQDNQSLSSYGVLRGLHFQKPPYTQSKLVRVLDGEILDVAVDVRRGSPYFGKYVSEILSSENHRQLWIPKGFAHGFLVLSEEAVFSYKNDNYYASDYESGLAWDDPDVGIDWRIPKEDIRLSEKDKKNPNLSDILDFSYEEFGK